MNNFWFCFASIKSNSNILISETFPINQPATQSQQKVFQCQHMFPNQPSLSIHATSAYTPQLTPSLSLTPSCAVSPTHLHPSRPTRTFSTSKYFVSCAKFKMTAILIDLYLCVALILDTYIARKNPPLKGVVIPAKNLPKS